MHKIKRFWLLVKQKLKVFDRIALITDKRKKPEIKLSTIIMSMLLMPFYRMKSLLGLDRLARKKTFKRLFNCERKMVASDSTISRALHWMEPDEIVDFQQELLPVFQNDRLQRIQVDKEAPYRTIGIIDGSCMSNHYPSTSLRAGLDKAQIPLGDNFPQLMLFNALYFNENSFNRVREKGAHILIKCKEPEFREVLKNARFIFDAKGEVTDQVTSADGFDSGRMCKWKIEITSGDFTGYPIKIAHLSEDYPLANEDKSHIECWIVTTDFSLSPNEIREIVHNGWLRGALRG